ncbi:MAG: adenylosuccinate lyase [Phycisphaerae bacterium]|nr:adenylosuccinate lyase [Phycisphaerae bacterium]
MDSDQHCSYRSPLETRNASRQMRAIWSPRNKFSAWRRIWLALAESQEELGLPISQEQLSQLRETLQEIDFEAAARYEKKLRHDVMAHVHAWGDLAPEARGIIHLGATSQDIVCNGDLMQVREGLQLLELKIARVIHRLGLFAVQWRDLPTLGFTHYQPAQPTTVGKRATTWAQDLLIGLEDVRSRRLGLRWRGMRGATGTQASFLALFEGDGEKVRMMEQLVGDKLGFADVQAWPVSGQTYPRLYDAQVVSSLAITAAAIHKMCNDLRLLSNRREIEEPFEQDQIGSSAMAYKRNPMRCERATGLSRFVMSLVQNPLDTAATQWFERTLDDSSNRRLSLPESMLALDGALDIMINVTSGLVVYPKVIQQHLAAELPFMATENILMEAAKLGVDRQEGHEAIRQHSHEAATRIKSGLDNDLVERLKSDPLFKDVPIDELMDPASHVGLAAEQVDQFTLDVVEPIRLRYKGQLDDQEELNV